MTTKTITLAVAGAILLSACKEEAPEIVEPTHATITLVEAVTEEIKTPHEVCNDVVVTKKSDVKDEGKVLGTLGGAAAGAALGNQVGGGSGKTVATAVGTVAGAMTGRKIQDNAQQNSTVTTTERRCTTKYTASTEVVGYDVTYKVAGLTTTTRMKNQPQENTFPIIGGQVIIPQ
ncbi:glycine zipper 2TM domain-containing protein [Vibrio sp. ZSDE26]|uniref:Glycine zipper 2TM domain-containing protein n=1 Tax=Vibrio amylolyticus TaxID=2847292 RepID=A0A9X1XN22_9VIBR|nr:glycine zipper 2TM domain-containing protein [Vibrio amylolyticus]MCK6265771.1 glycine zipper 2TM domain-containing protein [Vibrio amylolyticus]